MPRVIAVGVVGVTLAVAWFDARAIPPATAVPQEAFVERSAVKFLRDATSPCPVAQLPEDGFPNPRVLPNAEAVTIDALYYRGFVPYLIAPEYFWSYTSWHPGAVNGLQSIPTELTDAAMEDLAAKGFCGVLYDRILAEAATAMSLDVAGRVLASERQPDYSNDRYDVFLLDR